MSSLYAVKQWNRYVHQGQGAASTSAWVGQTPNPVRERPSVWRRIQYITRPNEEADMEKYRYYVDLPGDLWEDGTFMDLIRMNAAPLVQALAAVTKFAQILRTAAGRWTRRAVQVGCLAEKRALQELQCHLQRVLKTQSIF